MSLSSDDLDLREILTTIKARPAMYLGGVSFERLYGFIEGFSLGRHYPRGDHSVLLGSFQTWLSDDSNIGDGLPWQRIIRCISCDDHDAFNTFFKKFDAFVKEKFPE